MRYSAARRLADTSGVAGDAGGDRLTGLQEASIAEPDQINRKSVFPAQ
jgi:hypothetical protein